MSEYYHVILETNEKNKKGHSEYVHWFDCQDLSELDEDIITPYVQKEQLYIDGHYVEFNNIRSLTIKKSQQPIQSLVDAVNARMIPGVFFVANRVGVVKGEKGFENVTKQLVKEKKKQIAAVVVPEKTEIKNTTSSSNKVFIVHGHDNEAKLDMARFLEKSGIDAIVLHEQVNSSMTIIEKIEVNSDIGFAVVLYTPCDVGAMNSKEAELQARARQNVVFEHGYFIGFLGRAKVSAFVKGDIEKPNDISGVVYTDLDAAGAWKMTLLKELKEAGYKVNANSLI